MQSIKRVLTVATQKGFKVSPQLAKENENVEENFADGKKKAKVDPDVLKRQVLVVMVV